MKAIRKEQDILDGLKALITLDPRLQEIVDAVNDFPLRREEEGFAGLTRIIIGQQVSRASAVAITERLHRLVYPLTPESYLEAGETAWIEIGLSRPKQKTLFNLATSIQCGALKLEGLSNLPAEYAQRLLVAQHGIGPWTAEVYLLFCVGHCDIFPAGDLALQEAVRHAFNFPERPDEKQTRDIASTWKPFRGIAARLFWSYYRIIKEGREAQPV